MQPVRDTSSSILILSAISEIKWFLMTSNVWESLKPDIRGHQEPLDDLECLGILEA